MLNYALDRLHSRPTTCFSKTLPRFDTCTSILYTGEMVTRTLPTRNTAAERHSAPDAGNLHGADNKFTARSR